MENNSINIEDVTIQDPDTFKSRPLFWMFIRTGDMKDIWGPDKTGPYKSERIQGNVLNGNPIGVWSYRESSDSQVKEEILFIR